MKKILPIILCCFIPAAFSFAQISKGTVLLGGDLSFNTQTSKEGNMEYQSNGFLISPVIAKAVKENVFWGGSLSFGSNEYNPPSPGAQQKLNSYGAGVFYRKYKPVMGKFYAFLQAGINGNFGKNKYRQNPDYYYDDKSYSVGLNITPGVSFGVSKKLFLEAGFNNIASLSYQHSKTTGYNFGNSIDRSSSSFGFSSSLGVFSNSLYFGFRFMLDPKKS